MDGAAVPRYDAVVVGGGLGGLLAAAVIARTGRSVLVVERLPYLGGRFTTIEQDGYALTTGALHMLPHGSGGVVARTLRDLGIPFRAVPYDAYGSFTQRGRHFLWRRPLDIVKLFGPRARLDLLRILLAMTVRRSWYESEHFAAWLRTRTRDATLRRCFERFVEFALSVKLEEVSYEEMRAIFWGVCRYGPPELPVGGCKAVIDALAAFIQQRGGAIQVSTQATRLLLADGGSQIVGVRVQQRRTHEESVIRAGRVISAIGPTATRTLLPETAAAALPSNEQTAPAVGMKLHVVSDRSLIPHNGVLFCLDTQRIAGIVEVSRAVPSLVPPGMHMLNTFQVLQSEDIALERARAFQDLRQVFGAAFDRHCRVVRVSAFRRSWPVNHARQGLDLRRQQPLPGLIMVGDAYKPSGHIMAEGVAASVRSVARALIQG